MYIQLLIHLSFNISCSMRVVIVTWIVKDWQGAQEEPSPLLPNTDAISKAANMRYWQKLLNTLSCKRQLLLVPHTMPLKAAS